MSYSIIGDGNRKKRMAIDSFESLARQEDYRNKSNEQIESAEDAQEKSTYGTAGGMALAQAVNAGTAAGTTAAGTTAGVGGGVGAGTTAAVGTSTLGTTAAAGTTGLSGAATAALAAVPVWGWLAIGAVGLFAASGGFD